MLLILTILIQKWLKHLAFWHNFSCIVSSCLRMPWFRIHLVDDTWDATPFCWYFESTRFWELTPNHYKYTFSGPFLTVFLLFVWKEEKCLKWHNKCFNQLSGAQAPEFGQNTQQLRHSQFYNKITCIISAIPRVLPSDNWAHRLEDHRDQDRGGGVYDHQPVWGRPQLDVQECNDLQWAWFSGEF